MRIARLERLVERAERDAARAETAGLPRAWYVEINGVWYGPDTYLQPFIDEVIDLSERIHIGEDLMDEVAELMARAQARLREQLVTI